MSEAWKKLDLGGEGLQSINAKIANRQKRTLTAYILSIGFPLGLHMLYAGQPPRALFHWALTLAVIVVYFTAPLWAVLIPAALSVALLAVDLFQMEDLLVRFNKNMRIQLMLQKSATNKPPKNYKGRYTDETDLDEYMNVKEQERGGHVPVDMNELHKEEYGNKPHVPSFNEQERMLKEMIKAKQEKK